MRKLTDKEKQELIREIKATGWSGCYCDECLLKIAERVLEYQFKIENEHD